MCVFKVKFTTEKQNNHQILRVYHHQQQLLAFRDRSLPKKSGGENKMLASGYNGDYTVHNAVKYSIGKSLMEKCYTTFLRYFLT